MSDSLLDITELIEKLAAKNGSDLHLAVGEKPVVRIHGFLKPVHSYGLVTAQKIEKAVRKVISEDKWAEFERTNELDTGVTVGRGHRLRINLYRQQNTPAAAIRLLPDEFFEFDEIGLPPAVLERITDMHSGLILVTGATGSGKSTTIASIVNKINQTRACHIHTIEDPVEYRHRSGKSLVTQREVGSDTASFSEALRRAMREDPDVVVVGEMRDLETTSAALTMAETGHLTFATLHTSDAVQTVSRIISQYPAAQQGQARDQLASTLRIVICQRLVPWDNGKGRSPAAEILVANSATKALIRDGKMHQIGNVIQTGQSEGMQTLDQSLQEIMQDGYISRHTAAEYSNHPQDFLTEEESASGNVCSINRSFQTGRNRNNY